MARSRTPTVVLEEKRAAPRISECVNAFVIAGRRRVPFTVDSLSESGARLIGSLALVRGQRVDIDLELDGALAEVVGEVVRVDTPDLLADHIAVHFVHVSPRSRLAIRAVVARTFDLADDDDTFVAEVATDEVAKLEDGEAHIARPLSTTRAP